MAVSASKLPLEPRGSSDSDGYTDSLPDVVLSAADWLMQSGPEHPALVYLCEERLELLPTSDQIPGYGPAIALHSKDLLDVLSCRWLNDEVLNAGMDWIMQQHSRSTARVRTVNCLLLAGLSAMRRRGTYNPRRRSALDVSICSGEVDVLFIPLHVDGNHWTLLKIDIAAATYAYADSRKASANPPREAMDTLFWWLSLLVPDLATRPLSAVEPLWTVPVQEDGDSCGIVVLSSINAILLGGASWSQSSAVRHRLEWFIRLTAGLTEGDEDIEGELVSDPGEFAAPAEDDDTTSMDTLPGSVECGTSSAQTCTEATATPFTLSLDVMDWELYDGEGATEDRQDLSAPSQPQFPLTPLPSATSFTFQQAATRSVSSTTLASSSPPQVPTDGQSVIANFFAPRSSSSSAHRKPPVKRLLCSPETTRETSVTPRPPKAQRESLSHSWAYQKDLAVRAQEPGFEVNAKKMANFRQKILAEDSHALFDDTKPLRARCSACGFWTVARVLYEVAGWRIHRKSDKCTQNRRKGLVSTSLLSLWQPASKTALKVASTTAQPERANVLVPCPGLQRAQDKRIAVYLARTSTNGGGAPSRAKIALQLFQSSTRPKDDCAWTALTYEERQMILRREQMLFQWRNLRSVGAVYSTSCERDVEVPDVQAQPTPCEKCRALLHVGVFRTQLNRPMPDESDMKYTPILYRNKEEGDIYLKYKGLRQLIEEDDGRSPWLKFSQGVVAGQFQDCQILLGAIQAMYIKSERVGQGKSLRNMTYSRIFSDFTNVLASLSPRAYQTFRQHFGGPHVRTLQKHRARLPRFRPGISPANITLALDVLEKIDYKGPVVLAWDDTALEPGVSVWEDATTGECFILGGSQGVIQVPSVDEFDALFEEAQKQKATKIRLYVLIVPLAKVPPIVIAAVARGGTEDAATLLSLHKELHVHLHAAGIYPVSYAADGTEVERALQRNILAEAENYLPYTIPNDNVGCTINLQIHLINKRPAVIVQDPKHALKTARNQLFTGARILVLGCLALFFAQLIRLALHPLAPLFRRDVERVDKQDDRAAARLFSAECLEVVLRYHSDLRALAVYLFVLGELVDAWENRHITHLERARMVMTARFFLMAWRAHVDRHPSYSTSVQFISRESFAIFMVLCDSLLSLIITYRNYYPHHPFMPWLHSTAPCEHIFGILRQLKKDFNFADLLYLEPKLRTLLLAAFERLTPLDRGNDKAGGYYHTYYDTTNMNLDNLRSWPTDVEMQDASQAAFRDAKQLLESLQLNAETLLKLYKPPMPKPPARRPGHASPQLPRAPQTLAELLTLYAPVALDPVQEKEANACEIALVAESLDRTLAIDALPKSCDKTELPAVLLTIKKQLEGQESPSSQPDGADAECSDSAESSSHTEDNGGVTCMDEPLYDSRTRELSIAVLGARRRRHQTALAQKAVRQYQQPRGSSIGNDDDASGSLSLRQQLMKRLACLVPENETFNATSGVDRHVRHTGSFQSSADSPARAAQKRTLRTVSANNHCRLRAEAFLILQDIHTGIARANLSPINPLIDGCFVVVYDAKAGNVLLGRVVTMYTKSNAPGSRHEHITAVDNIGIPSYVAVEVFVFSHGSTYSSLACQTLGCSTHLRFPPAQIIFSFATCASSIKLSNIETPDGGTLTMVTLCNFSAPIFDALRDRHAQVGSAVKHLTQLMRKKKSATLPAPGTFDIDEQEEGGSSSDEAEGA